MPDSVKDTKPVGPYTSFAACVAANQDKDDPEAYCAAIENAQDDKETGKMNPELEALKALLAHDPKGERKYFAGGAIKAIDEDSGEADIVASTGALDRDREVVEPEGMVLPKPRRVPLVSSHGYGDLRKHIGDVPRVRIDKAAAEIVARPRWFVSMGNPEADWGFQLARMGVAAFSIGFIPLEWVDADLSDEKVFEKVRDGKMPLRRFTKWELAEISQVIVPSNRGAVQRMVEAGIMTQDQMTAIKFIEIKDEPMSAEAQVAFDKALENWKAKAAEQATCLVDEAAMTDEQKREAERSRHDCPEGHVFNPDTGKCEKKAAEPEPAKGKVPEPATAPVFDILKLFEQAAKKQSDGRELSQAEKAAIVAYNARKQFPCPFPFAGVTECISRFEGENRIADPGAFCAEWERSCGERASTSDLKAAVVIEVKFEEHVLPKLEEALVSHDLKVDARVQAKIKEMLDEFNKALDTRIAEVAKQAVASAFGPDSAAHTATTDIIYAVTTGVKPYVDQMIQRAKGNVDFWPSA